MKTIFVHVLRKIMSEKGLNQLELSKILGVRQSQVSNWINEKSLPNYRSLQLIKTTLGVPVEDFFE